MSECELKDVLRLHGMWLRGEDGGECANLSGADLRCANLRGANLSGADLGGTVLDPNRDPNGDFAGFESDGEFITGYRTRKAGHVDCYRDGRYYSADFFSVCDRTECHPGLYLWPTLERAKQWSPGEEIIEVRTKPSEVHHVGDKWRCRWLYVAGTVEEVRR